jgi:NitT/TauT family transport system substrate-binding protein
MMTSARREIGTSSRRDFLKLTAAASTTVGLAAFPGGVWGQAKTSTVNMQIGWLASGNQIGEVCAKRLGYYEEEKLNLVIQPGGPSIDGVAIVASGRYEIGQVSSSPSLMLAASQKIPVKCFAVGAPEHPYAFYSLPRAPVRTPQDFIGKKVGIQATGKILLTALLRKNNIAEKDVTVVVAGADMTPLLTGQVDVFTGWLTNTSALKPLGPDRIDLRLWDAGVRLYALPYYATQDTLAKKPEVLAAFLRATAKGWKYARDNQESAVDLLVKEYPNLDRNDEIDAAKVMLRFAFTESSLKNGFGAMDLANWQAQIALYDELKEFSAGAPKLDDVAVTSVLDATKDARLKLV